MGCFGSSLSAGQDAQERGSSGGKCGESFHDSYVLCRKLGKGAFASVYSAQKVHGGGQLAVKISDLRAAGTDAEVKAKRCESAWKEVELLRRVSTLEHVVGYVGWYVEEGLSYIMMEKGDATLLQALESAPLLNEEVLMHTFRGMLQGIEAVHGLGVVHRDVKPDNFLFVGPGILGPQSRVKLCDFGLAACAQPSCKESLRGVHGTPPYMAPEMLLYGRYGAGVDVWSFGVIAYVLLLGEFPYKGSEHTSTAMKAAILDGLPAPRFRFAPGVHIAGAECISGSAMRLLRALLARRPRERPSAEAALQHDAFSTDTEVVGRQVSLRPMLYSAARSGAFDRPLGEDDPKTDLDHLLDSLQAARARDKAFAEGSGAAGSHSPASDAPTQAGTWDGCSDSSSTDHSSRSPAATRRDRGPVCA